LARLTQIVKPHPGIDFIEEGVFHALTPLAGVSTKSVLAIDSKAGRGPAKLRSKELGNKWDKKGGTPSETAIARDIGIARRFSRQFSLLPKLWMK
jgi:hypothetical protein